MCGTRIESGQVSWVLPQGAEVAEQSLTVHVPLLLQSSAFSATSAVNLFLFLNAGPTTVCRRHTNASRAAKKEDCPNNSLYE